MLFMSVIYYLSQAQPIFGTSDESELAGSRRNLVLVVKNRHSTIKISHYNFVSWSQFWIVSFFK